LIEMGDLDCATRTLETLKPEQDNDLALWKSRMVLLRIKMGDITRARRLVDSENLVHNDKVLLEALLAVAEDRHDDASKLLFEAKVTNSAAVALVKQNLAVAHLYGGEVRKARQLLEELINDGQSFQTLTINLATIYDLTSEKSRELKMKMVSQIADQQKDPGQDRSYVTADFKL